MARSNSPAANADEGRRRQHNERDRQHTAGSQGDGREGGGRDFQVKDSGGEVSMSLEETNRMRISLGLKPLNMDTPKTSKVPKAVEEARAKKAEAEEKSAAEDLAVRIAEKRERRRQEEKLRSVKTLGEADDVDDTAAWVERSRLLEEKRKEELRKKALEEEERRQRQQAAAGDDDATVEGLKVKADLEELVEGDTVIMTLEDAPILNEKMELNEGEDVLINVQMREQYKRDKARRLAGKPAKALFGEDGKVRALLDKYDDEEDQQAIDLEEGGKIDLEKQRRQDAIKQKLAAGNGLLDNAETMKQAAAEFYTADEAAALFKPKKRKKKKVLRQREDEGALDLDALEAEAAAAGTSALGSRSAREGKTQQDAAALKEVAARKRQKYDNVLEQANYAALALKPGSSNAAEVEDNFDVELVESLKRAQQAAQQAGPSKEKEGTLLEVAKKRRQEAEAKLKQRAEQQGGLAFSDTSEFVRQVVVQEEEDEGGLRSRAPRTNKRDGAETEAMDHDADAEAAAAAEASGRGKVKRAGNWVTEEEVMMRDFEEVTGISLDPTASEDKASREDEEMLENTITRQQATATGLAGTLQLLREKGELKKGVEGVQWSGRTNDMKKVNLTGLDEVYKNSDDMLEKRVETALTRKDALGRVLTPKQRFRELCYGFHGIYPSKNKKDAAMRKDSEEISKMKRATTDSVNGSTVDALKKVQAVTHTPYIMLSGQLKPGQISDPASEYALGDKANLPGTATPLLGAKKAAAMLGIEKPPQPKKPKRQ